MLDEQNHSFFEKINQTFFTAFGKRMTSEPNKKMHDIPFKDHSHFSIMLDALYRKESHHLILNAPFSATFNLPFLFAFNQRLQQETLPHAFHQAELIYLDLEQISLSSQLMKSITADCERFIHALSSTQKIILLALNHFALPSDHEKKSDLLFWFQHLQPLITHPYCRLILFNNNLQTTCEASFDSHFTSLSLDVPNETDIIALLKQERLILENYHHVTIPEELLSYAYYLTERYLSTNDVIRKTCLLLDSSAARASVSHEEQKTNSVIKPTLTLNHLIQVLASWTQIPATHLHLAKFKLNEFIQGMSQHLFGQELAIQLIAHELQQSQAHLHQNTGPLGRFIFIGPAHCGKKSTAAALSDQLFNQRHALYFAHSFNEMTPFISELTLQHATTQRYDTLKEIIVEKPYAIIVFDDIEAAPAFILDGLVEIFNTGYLKDAKGQQYNFRQAIFILCTTDETARLTHLIPKDEVEVHHQPIDLMQLVLNEKKQDTHATPNHVARDEIMDELQLMLKEKLPHRLSRHLHPIPFSTLSSEAIEKIIRTKLKKLCKMLDVRYGIELSYASEVIRYLVNNVLMKKELNHKVDLDKTLRPLYLLVEQTIINQTDNKNRPTQLTLQLNETGQLLRCDWLLMTPIRHHAP